MSLQPRAVIVRRRGELEELVDRHGTRGQVEFFLRSRGRTLAEVQERADQLGSSLEQVAAAIPAEWRRGGVERADIDRFLFEPEDIVIVVGPDGLVANVAKYLNGQPVVGVNPDPTVPGVLVQHRPSDVVALLGPVAAGQRGVRDLTMVRAEVDDGQSLDALNEIFIGHPSHQSARYRLAPTSAGGAWERQSSSGVIVSTGTGATGWCASIMRERGVGVEQTSRMLPAPDAGWLAWFVREAWPSATTGVSLTWGQVYGEPLQLVVESESLVVFGDGMEDDRLAAHWGQSVRIGLSDRRLRLIV